MGDDRDSRSWGAADMKAVVPIAPPAPPPNEYAELNDGQLLSGVQEALTVVHELRKELMRRGVSLTFTYENSTNVLVAQVIVMPKR
jgi:hypothetical protein